MSAEVTLLAPCLYRVVDDHDHPVDAYLTWAAAHRLAEHLTQTTRAVHTVKPVLYRRQTVGLPILNRP